jgi:hypothetical protein
MDETLIIDHLQNSPQYASRIQIRNNEFFECDWCGRLCQMPIEQYKTYSEDVILKSKYRCKGCAKKMGRGRPRKTDNTTVNQQLTTEQVANANPTILHEIPNIINPAFTTNQKELTIIIDHPPHYTAGGIECIDAIMAAVEGLTPQEAVCVANVIKYTWRFKRKNGKQDLEKAKWYLNRLSDLQGV